MKTMILMLSTLAVGCSDEADIGVSSTPMTCAGTTIVNVSGNVTDPNNNTSWDFNTASPVISPATDGGASTLTLRGEALSLRFGFYCGSAQVAKYGVKGDTQEGLACPLEVASTVLGRIEYLPAKSGTFIVDENANCFAGRFHVDFGENGEISGAFSVPWQ